MTRSRIPQNPKGDNNQEDQNSPMDEGLAEVVSLLTNMFRHPQLRQVRIPIRVYAVTQRDVDVGALGTAGAGIVTSILLGPMCG